MRARPSPTDTRSRVGLLAALAAGTALVTAGCSLGTQTSSLTAVSGDRVALVRAAAQDILVQKSIRVHVWPQCTATGNALACQGSTVDNAVIAVESPATSPVTMTVSVGGQELFSGAVQPVIDQAAGQNS